MYPDNESAESNFTESSLYWFMAKYPILGLHWIVTVAQQCVSIGTIV